jgi:hypothetical protein
MNKFILFILGFLFTSGKCFLSDDNFVKSQKIFAVRITGNMPAITNDTSFTISGSYDIFYYKDLILYKFQYRFDSLVDGKLLLQEWRSNFFAYHKDSLFGYSYYPKPDAVAITRRVSIDTMFKRNAYQPFKFDSIFHSKPDSLYFDEQKNFVKVYNVDTSEKYPEKVTYYFYYSKKFAGLTESFFSQTLDNEKGLKLFKIRIVLYGHRYEEYKIALPERELLYEMIEIPIKNRTEILNYFDRYKKDISH